MTTPVPQLAPLGILLPESTLHSGRRPGASTPTTRTTRGAGLPAAAARGSGEDAGHDRVRTRG